ncbi:hypothetical protein [Brevundimonas aurantiaca]|uniref:hypothetical protein n=1 Tax=Brevundimonas aurantiaca TaxID=74316 RepID=UPI001D196FAA|nr:hypothetical protein [Brevundimonas aurantiaca]MCC4295814.1 hypothetical protein [Brevundimonas aurantiaca]
MSGYEWKVGQEVFVPYRGWGGNPGMVRTIDRVTPSGRAVVGHSTYDKTGREIGGGHYRGCILPATDDHRADIARFERKSAFLRMVETIKWSALTPEQIEELAPILRKYAQPKAPTND